MEEVEELVRQYGLEEDLEYVIIPFTDGKGSRKRRFILKRPYIRIVYDSGYFVDYLLQDVIKAAVRNPDLSLSEALYRMNVEIERNADEPDTEEKGRLL
ncbi:MAG TPA: hypothetical protein VK435_08475 [Thermodesulfovibrionales bacterium]|nr:hypothetical protein [Thermodesulfovibrionales bacterium]